MMVFARPLSDPGDMRIALFNEFVNSLYLYTDMLLTDFHGYDTMRDQFGSCLVVILGVTVGVNFFRLGWKILEAIIQAARYAKRYLYGKFGWFEPKKSVAIKPGFDLTQSQQRSLTSGAKTLSMHPEGKGGLNFDKSVDRDVSAMINLFNGTSTLKIPNLKVHGMRGDNSIVSVPKVDLE
jgi:hypothetical protein